MGWKVHVIAAGEFGPMPEWMRIRSEGSDPGKNIPSYIFLIENGSERILVDTSFSSTEDIDKYMGIYCKRDKSIADSLAEYGLSNSDIDIVVLTHLHWDHAGNMFDFPNARIICQREELDWMHETHQWEIGYPDWFFERIIENQERIELIDGHAEIIPGIHALPYGGHTPGSQMIQVEADDGTYIIPGDNIMSYENIEREVPIGLYCNIHKCIASIELVKRLAAKCLPSHDWKTLRR